MAGRMQNNPVDIYKDHEWHIVRSHKEFTEFIVKHGVPDIVSFDHDLAPEHYSEAMYNSQEEYNESIKGSDPTGYDSAMWMMELCFKYGLTLPKWEVHSMNPVGVSKIKSLLSNRFLNRNEFGKN
jgi:hypothetical protein